MINKQTRNTGSSGGHSMTKIDIALEIAKEDSKLLKEHSGHSCGCGGSCGNSFLLSISDYTTDDVAILGKWLAHGGCPYCGGIMAVMGMAPKPDLTDKRIDPNTIESHVFYVNGHEFKCVRKPDSYRPYRKSKTIEQVEKMVARQTRSWIK